MKKTLMALACVMGVFFLTSAPSSAHSSFYFGFYPPPAVVAPPSAYYSPPAYYSPGYYPSPPPRAYRVWIPRHWEWRRGLYRWERVWVPGHWQYR